MRLSLRGVTVFSGIAEIDFDALGPGLVAIVGPNGAGKSTLMGAVVAALHKVMPDRPGHLQNYCRGTDSFVEAVFEDAGDEIKVRVQVDAEHRRTDTYVFVNGASATTGRAAEHEAEIEKRFGSLALLLASVYASQSKQGNFLQASKGERKKLFIELLNLGFLEVMATQARERKVAAERELERARQQVADVEAELQQLPQEERALRECQAEAEMMMGAVTDARTEEAAALAALERARGAEERITSLRQAEQSAAASLTSTRRAQQEARQLAPSARKRSEERRLFIARSEPEKGESKARQRHDAATVRLRSRRQAAEAALTNAPSLAAAQEAVSQIEAARQAELARVREAARLQGELKAAEADLRVHESARRQEAEAHDREVARLDRQAALLPQVPCTTSLAWLDQQDDREPVAFDLAGTCPLLADARGARAKLEALAPPAGESEALSEVRQLVAALKEQVADLPPGAAPTAPEEQAARAALRRAEAGVTARETLSGIEREQAALDEQLDADLVEAAETLRKATAELAAIEAQLVTDIEAADSRVAAADIAVETAEHQQAAAQIALEEALAGAVSLNLATAAADACRNIREAAEKHLRDADLARAKAQAAVEALQERGRGLDALRDRVAGFERELGDWSLLERGLGKDGAQALEIDAAGPEVARITNELLASCYGPRFSIAFETLREKKSAKGEYSESFDVKVFDAGAERPVEALSGGEKVVVGEAIGLAIAIVNARKSGIRWETLWRDETAGALDPENADRYVLMLRRARELGGFAQVIFVSHSPEVWEAADVRLVVAGGRVTVEGARRAAA